MTKSKRVSLAPSKQMASPLIPKHLAKDEFARRLYKLMIDKGWRQADLARSSGLPRNAVSVYMRGASLPNRDSLKALAKAFNVDPDMLLPNYKESAIDRDNPAIDFRVSTADPKQAWLRINRLVSTSLAVKILAMLEAEDAQTANRN